MAHNVGSFDYKVTHPDIQKVLKRRTYLDNTTQLAMPFVKATTTIQIPEYLGKGCIGFSLGLHAIDEDVLYENMYAESSGLGTYPLIGYTHEYKDGIGKPKRIYAKPPDTQVTLAQRLFDQGNDLASTTEFGRIPPPGITNVTVGRNKNGLLAVGEIKFSVPSLVQLELLHRTFLIPGCGMILEWGQQFAKEAITTFAEQDFGKENYVESGTTDLVAEHLFPWHDEAKVTALLKRLGDRQVGLKEILDDYVYPTNGQYMWMFGRVANFSTKANSDGSYECEVKIVGPSEDQWAYSTRATVVPGLVETEDFTCVQANSIERYFTVTSPGLNLKTLLDAVLVNDSALKARWGGHVIKIDNGNKKEGDKTNTVKPVPEKPEDPNIDKSMFMESDHAYFFTWKFFINVVINDPDYGLMRIFKDGFAADDERLKKIGLLRPYADESANMLRDWQPQHLNDKLESYVGSNRYLRSIDPSVMVIVNPEAIVLARKRISEKFSDQLEEITNKLLNIDSVNFKKFFPGDPNDPSIQNRSGIFHGAPFVVTPALSEDDPPSYDKGFLSSGVWLNHQAVCIAMTGAPTFLRGIANLLDKMNHATMNFWDLTLDPIEPVKENDGKQTNTYNYTVIDANWRASSEQAVKIALDKIYIFNKYARRDRVTNKLIGSELTDCNVDLSLPKRMFSQIATLGLVQKEDLVNAGGQVSSGPDTEQNTKVLISEPNEILRKMFAITSLSVQSPEQGPDLTIPPYSKEKKLTGQCKQNVGQTANVGGFGQATADVTIFGAVKVSRGPGAGYDEVLGTRSSRTEAQQAVNERGEKTYTQLNEEASKWLEDNATKCAEAQCFPPEPPTPQSTDDVICPGEFTLGVHPLANPNPQGGTGTVTSPYNERRGDRDHKGVDLRAAQGTVVKATNAGTVKLVGDQSSGWGNYVVIEHDNKFETLYAHLSEVSASPGTEVKAGDEIGKSGGRPGTPGAGNSEAEHLHFEIRKIMSGDRSERNPEQCLSNIGKTPTSTPAPSPFVIPEENKQLCFECNKQREIRNQTQKQIPAEQAVATVERKWPHLNEVLAWIEPFPDEMVTLIRGDSDDLKSNAFGAAPGTLSIAADLVMPGINGFRVGELFWIDRIPAFYRAFGAFQVISIEEVINKEGWQTKIHSRFHYLGGAWKASVLNLINSAIGGSREVLYRPGEPRPTTNP